MHVVDRPVDGALMDLLQPDAQLITREYGFVPDEIRPVPVDARTNLLWFEERCTGCSTCAQACPDGCILVQTSPREDGSLLETS